MSVETDLDRLIISTNQIASFPAIVHRITQAVENPYHSLAKIGQVVADDPGLTARLLKIANSPFFKFPVPITSITRALAVIGTKQLRDLITSTCVLNLFPEAAGELIDLRDFWRHSIACGVAARVIATARREINVERFYLGGLLHDVGRLVLYLQRPEQSRRVLLMTRQEKALVQQAETTVFGYTHGVVGSELLRNWNLPADLYQPILWLHTPSQATDFHLETAILHVADYLALALGLGSSGACRLPPLDQEAWSRIGLPVSAVQPLVDQIDSQYLAALDAFLD